jgi:glycosyltransferase involved in cell wall biosynthesis
MMISDLYNNKKRNLFLLCLAYLNRIKTLLTIHKYDFIWIEKELLPFFPSFLEMIFISKKTKYFLDYDDAIFHNYDFNNNKLLKYIYSNKFKNIISKAYKIFVGNQYLFNYAYQWNKNITYIYSVVDERLYKSLNSKHIDKFTIGWIGSPSTTKYLNDIIKYLNRFKNRHNIRLITIGASELKSVDFELLQLEWKLDDEVKNINLFDVGIMPLKENSWENGKCGFKLIQYMACSIPVIASPVGINKEIVSKDVGFLAHDEKDWIDAIVKLMEDEETRLKFGSNGRKKVENNFSFYNNINILSSSFNI